MKCYCCSGATFAECCEPYLKLSTFPTNALALMRSRYSAYAVANADYILNTTHPSSRKYHSKNEILSWAKSNKWVKLEIISYTDIQVIFKAYYKDPSGKIIIHFENSRFEIFDKKWYYVDGHFEG